MTRLKRMGILFVCTAIAVVLVPQMAFAQTQGMTYQEYEAKNAEYMQKVAGLKKSVAECSKAADELSQQISQLDDQIAAVQQEIYQIVGGDEEQIREYIRPFGVDLNQHLVLSGHNLSKIAGVVYKDVTKWHKIYQANKTQILDANLIFPAQVLDIPVN